MGIVGLCVDSIHYGYDIEALINDSAILTQNKLIMKLTNTLVIGFSLMVLCLTACEPKSEAGKVEPKSTDTTLGGAGDKMLKASEEIGAAAQEKAGELSASIKETTGKVAGAVQEKTSDIGASMKETADKVTEAAKDKTEQMTEAAKETAEKVKEAAKEKLNEAGAAVKETTEKVNEAVKDSANKVGSAIPSLPR